MSYLLKYLRAALVPVCIALAATGDADIFSAIMMIAAIVAIYLMPKDNGSLFFAGALIYALCFSWLAGTLERFGGFPATVAFLLFLLFIFLSALQMVFFGALFRAEIYPRFFRQLGLVFPLAWTGVDFLMPKMFPWTPAHFLLAIKPVALLASVVGPYGLTFLCCWAAENSIRGILEFQRKGKMKRFALTFTIITLSCSFGYYLQVRLDHVTQHAQRISVALVQGNLSTETKGKSSYLKANLAEYVRLSEKRNVDLLVWPESVMSTWTPVNMENIRDTKYDPFPEQAVSLIYGVLSYEQRSKDELAKLESELGRPLTRQDMERVFHWYNSAFVLDPVGGVAGVYHKRALMPLGEYLPFEESFPWVRSLSPQSGRFSVGHIAEPVRLQIQPRGGELEVPVEVRSGLLVCYEDLLSALSVDYVRRGANILVNVTNDAWYGQTAAPYQHELLASWRAVETGRVLLRATNTGATAGIMPDGTAVGGLPIFTAAVSELEVPLLSHVTFYVAGGHWLEVIPSFVLLLLLFGGFIVGRQKGFSK
ncbi:MAG: apolipoprotein N-acyltransferase [bacterium]|nr:apolipoprotein N-acyltransferase [bacterium]